MNTYDKRSSGAITFKFLNSKIEGNITIIKFYRNIKNTSV